MFRETAKDNEVSFQGTFLKSAEKISTTLEYGTQTEQVASGNQTTRRLLPQLCEIVGLLRISDIGQEFLDMQVFGVILHFCGVVLGRCWGLAADLQVGEMTVKQCASPLGLFAVLSNAKLLHKSFRLDCRNLIDGEKSHVSTLYTHLTAQ